MVEFAKFIVSLECSLLTNLRVPCRIESMFFCLSPCRTLSSPIAFISHARAIMDKSYGISLDSLNALLAGKKNFFRKKNISKTPAVGNQQDCSSKTTAGIPTNHELCLHGIISIISHSPPPRLLAPFLFQIPKFPRCASQQYFLWQHRRSAPNPQASQPPPNPTRKLPSSRP